MVSLLLVFFFPDYYVEMPAVFQRAGEADSVSAGCLSAWGEGEADEWGMGGSRDGAGGEGEQICLRFV